MKKIPNSLIRGLGGGERCWSTFQLLLLSLKMTKSQIPFVHFRIWDGCEYTRRLVEVFVFNKNLTFLYKLTLMVLKSFSKNINLSQVGIELTTLTTNGLEARCLFHSATHTCVELKILKLNFVSCSISLFGLRSFLDSIEQDFIRV